MLSPIGVRYDPALEGLSDKEKVKLFNKRFEGRKGPPAWARALATSFWNKRMSPFSFARFVGRKRSLKFIEGYVKNRQKVEGDDQGEAVRDYMYQIFMRPGTTEYALMICFDIMLYCRYPPLANPERMASKEFPIPVSFIYGDADWVLSLEGDAGKNVVEANQSDESRYHIVAHSDHNMHMDNPVEFANIIINDIFVDANMPLGNEPQELDADYISEFLENVDTMAQQQEDFNEDKTEFENEAEEITQD